MKALALYLFVLISTGCGGPPAQQEAVTPEQPGLEQYVETHDKEAAKKLIARSIQEADALFEKGMAQLKKKEVVAALASFQQSIEIYPLDTRPYFMLVQLLINLKQQDQALRVLEEAGVGTNKYALLYRHFFRTDWGYENRVESEDRIHIAPFKDNKKGALSFILSDN